MTKIPENHNWVKFHHKEWLTKLSIRSCDAATRGIYQDLFALAMTTDETGIIPSTYKQICKQLAIKPSQFNRALKQLINVKLCVIGKNEEIILTEIASDYDSLVSQQAPVENPTSAQRELNGRPTSKENGEKQPKIDLPIIDKNRIDKNKKESNPPNPLIEDPPDNKTILFNESLTMLSQITRLEEEKCRPVIGRWLKQLGGNVDMLVSLIDKGLLANAPIPYISKMVANAIKVNHGSNVAYFHPRKTNKQQMTEAWGLCESMVEFQARYGKEEPTLEQLQSHNPRKAWGA